MISTLLCALVLQGPPPVKDMVEVCLGNEAEYQLLTQTISDVDDHGAPVREAGCWRVRAYATDSEQALLETCRDELEDMARNSAAMAAAKLNGRAKVPRRATAH